MEVVRAFSQSARISGPHFEDQSFVISLAWERWFFYTLFNVGGALIDEGIGFRPLGRAGGGAT